MEEKTPSTQTYAALLASIKERIQSAQVRAALAVNRELGMLYWGIGTEIIRRQKVEGWGTKVIDNLGRDLKSSFPEMRGLSPRNLKYMKAFADAWPEEPIVQQAAAQLPWFHNCILLDKVKDPAERLWYMHGAIENGWSRNMLALHIEAKLFQRQGKATTNFHRTLPSPQSDLAQQLLKDPYNFDFLTLSKDAHERELEAGLVEHIRKFLLELGVGFSFVGSQYPLEIAGESYRLDLLFYHLKLRCFIVIDLKGGAFKPEYTGKMNFYLAAVDDTLKHPADQPSIGLILCRTKKELVVEYALRGTTTPMGISEFTHLVKLPEEFKGTLPTIEEIEAELGPDGVE
ncbi:MAG: PDDEXK nuclease domain-containing protein [Bryobacteraceae bacterium]|nr:PDDEXK nuclease domain-containing protein [Bryobacteraceae bacterium]